MSVAAGHGCKASELMRLLAAAFVPFGFTSTLRFIKHRQTIPVGATASR